MSQPPASGRDPGADPGRDPSLPGGPAGSPGCPGSPVPGLGDFARGGAGDSCPPGPGLAAALDRVSGPDRRCAQATDDELTGILSQWAAMESWAAAAKLGVLAELVRRRARPGFENRAGGDMPGAWEEGTGHEVAGALALSLSGADKLADVAWMLHARLPGIYASLVGGTIDALKASIICRELSVLDEEQAARAEALILGQLAGKTPMMIGRLAAQAACTVDPRGTQKRRERAEREDARVQFWRENSGACALAAYGLPTDAALAANANIKIRAVEYKKANVSPDATMDQLRVLAYLDILNGITADARIAQARAAQAAEGQAGATDNSDDPEDCRGRDAAPGDGADGPALAASINLTIPLATLLGLAGRPGTGHGLGPIDPALCRDLSAAAARSPHSTWCVTVTDGNGIAVGHGCARPARTRRGKPPPARGRDGPPAFTPRDDPGPPGGYGSWTLTLPSGRDLDLTLDPIPVIDCDHRYESHGYQPSRTLRHLVAVRDGECTFPGCSRHARESDFEHAIPYDQGGRTCACNAGARSRRCHQVKQSKGWSVTQPLPGWHQWTAPSGRSYTQGPMKYPI
jgi:hypothetical protein